jgi:hypothetical protein
MTFSHQLNHTGNVKSEALSIQRFIPMGSTISLLLLWVLLGPLKEKLQILEHGCLFRFLGLLQLVKYLPHR